MDFTGKLVLAPMVRIGELPTRLLALKYGADLVWGPEIIDKKILQCDRVENNKLGTIDFLARTGNTKVPGVTNLVFRTARALEAKRLIFQMGTANADLAVQAAKVVINDVDGIDINAGCPKHFSVHSGMGAALLSTPDLLEDILKRLVGEVGAPHNKPISVKIRLLPERNETLALVDRLLNTGIANLTLHCRTKEMRNREAPIREYLHLIVDKCRERGVGFIVNGGIKGHADFKAIQAEYGEDVGCMVASAAEINQTCFESEPLKWAHLVKEFMRIAHAYDNWKGNSKYCLTRMIPPAEKKVYSMVCQAKEHDDLMKVVESIAVGEMNEEETEKVVESIAVEERNGERLSKTSNLETTRKMTQTEHSCSKRVKTA